MFAQTEQLEYHREHLHCTTETIHGVKINNVMTEATRNVIKVINYNEGVK